MKSNLTRRVAMMETGGGHIGLGEMIDALGSGVQFENPSTWPNEWQGRTLDPRVLRSLDGLPAAFDRYDARELRARLEDQPEGDVA